MEKAQEKNFRSFYLDKSKEQRAVYAKEAGTTTNYIETHLVTGYKIPRKKLVAGLVGASKGQITVMNLINFFYEVRK
jgi:hypothetical protein